MESVRAWQRLQIQLGIHLVKLVKHLLQGLFLALISHDRLLLIEGLVAKSGRILVDDRDSILVRRHLERDVFILVVLAVQTLSFDKLCEVLSVVSLLQLVVGRAFLLARNEGLVLVLLGEQVVLHGVIDSDRIAFDHLIDIETVTGDAQCLLSHKGLLFVGSACLGWHPIDQGQA